MVRRRGAFKEFSRKSEAKGKALKHLVIFVRLLQTYAHLKRAPHKQQTKHKNQAAHLAARWFG